MKNKYAWASITRSCTNFGNYLIEYNLKKVLSDKGFGKPSFVFDAFKKLPKQEIDKINSLDFVIVPGCTTLSTRHYPGTIDLLQNTNLPVFNLGATFFGSPRKSSVSIISKYQQPIGTRDPVSDKFLRDNGIKTKFIGCPTLFFGNKKSCQISDVKRIGLVFGLKRKNTQVQIMNRLLRDKYNIASIVQEKHQEQILNKLNVKTYKYSPENLLKVINKSDVMITGRLHATLPALVNGAPVIFLNFFDDSRFSLLDYIGLEMHTVKKGLVEEIPRILNKQSIDNLCQSVDYKKISLLRSSFSDYIDWVKKQTASL